MGVLEQGVPEIRAPPTRTLTPPWPKTRISVPPYIKIERNKWLIARLFYINGWNYDKLLIKEEYKEPTFQMERYLISTFKAHQIWPHAGYQGDYLCMNDNHMSFLLVMPTVEWNIVI
jgi:hypothetical protein